MYKKELLPDGTGYKQRDKDGKEIVVKFQKRETDGGYFQNDIDNEWKFVPFKKTQTADGTGYDLE